MNENNSPEEKLLKLIRGHKNQPPGQEKKAPVAVAQAAPEAQSNQKPPETFVVKSTQRVFNVKRALLGIFIITFFCLVITFIYPWLGLTRIKPTHPTETKPEQEAAGLKQATRSYDFYLQGMKDKRIFASVSTQNPEKPVNALSSDLLKDIALIGIISGENPQAIIEDKKTQETIYATKGQMIGEIRIEDIQEGKIIVNYKNERYELYL